LEIKTPFQHPDGLSSFHLYPIQVTESSGIGHRELYEALNDAGVKVNLHYIPVYLQPYYERLGFKQGYCPYAEAYFKSSISIPVYAGLTKEQQLQVINLMHSLCNAKT
jgi:dTDP-4-amino-4,6-dideoxygalactose transaminase